MSRNEIFLRACEHGYFMVAESYCWLYKDLDFEAGYQIACANHRRSIKRMITSNMRIRDLVIKGPREWLPVDIDELVYADIGGRGGRERSGSKDEWVSTGLILIVLQSSKLKGRKGRFRKGVSQLPDELIRMMAEFLCIRKNPYILNVA